MNLYEQIKQKERELEDLKERAKKEWVFLGRYEGNETMDLIYTGSEGLSNTYRNNNRLIEYFRRGNEIKCVFSNGGLISVKGIGISKCHPTDNFNLTSGLVLAETRARENYYKKLGENYLYTL